MQLETKATRSSKRISLTPLIDIVFILLIFFILETSFIEMGELALALPHKPPIETSVQKIGRPLVVLKIQIFSPEKLWISDRQVALNNLPSHLRGLNLQNGTRVVLEMPPYVQMQLVVAVLDILREQSLQDIQLKRL